jgi:hypothetical protein
MGVVDPLLVERTQELARGAAAGQRRPLPVFEP